MSDDLVDIVEPFVWPPTVPPATRKDSDTQATIHAQDHNQASAALTAIVAQINGLPIGGGYLHDQMTPAATWTVVHNLGYKPGGISANDSTGADIEGDVTYLDNNNLTIAFSAATSGKAYIS